MQRVKGASEDLAGEEQMAKIGALKSAGTCSSGRPDPAARSSSAKRAFLMLIGPLAGEELAVSGVSCRHHAVEHVDPARHRFDEIDGVPTPIR